MMDRKATGHDKKRELFKVLENTSFVINFLSASFIQFCPLKVSLVVGWIPYLLHYQRRLMQLNISTTTQ